MGNKWAGIPGAADEKPYADPLSLSGIAAFYYQCAIWPMPEAFRPYGIQLRRRLPSSGGILIRWHQN